MENKRKMKTVQIFPTVREKLTEYANANPHVKISYFVGDAILEKIERESQRKELTQMIGTHSTFRKGKEHNGTERIINAESGAGKY